MSKTRNRPVDVADADASACCCRLHGTYFFFCLVLFLLHRCWLIVLKCGTIKKEFFFLLTRSLSIHIDYYYYYLRFVMWYSDGERRKTNMKEWKKERSFTPFNLWFTPAITQPIYVHLSNGLISLCCLITCKPTKNGEKKISLKIPTSFHLNYRIRPYDHNFVWLFGSLFPFFLSFFFL